ncbi:WD40-repeat-containing domain protein [Scheffersomyces xylosifermentans]|uniref:WD40-repeat-containing domain protein n=1 Tax=Scheffersomyces xylosifermentans TaxID=1304137 RepID=UPI00315C7D66
MASEEFILQLIQKSLDDLGYGRISDDLGRAVKEKRLVSHNLGSDENSHETSQIKTIEWFTAELRAGHYLTIESYLLAVLSNIEKSTTNTNKSDVNFQDILVKTTDPRTVVLIILYLVRRIAFFETVISGIGGNIDHKAQLESLTEKLMPILDEIHRRLQLQDGKSAFMDQESANSVEDEFYSSDEIDESVINDLSLVFGSELLVALNRESESKVLLAFLRECSEHNVTSVLSPKYLFGYSIAVSTPSTILQELRSSLVEVFLGKIFKLNDKLRSFDEVYEIPSNYLSTIIEQSLSYQKQQNPYYLPPRTKLELNKRLNEKFEPFMLGKPPREINQFFKTNYFPDSFLHSLTSHTDEVWFTKFSPSGKFMVTGSLDGKLVIYDVLNNFAVLKILESSSALDNQVFVPFSSKPSSGKTKAVIYCCWDPQEQYLVSCCLDTVVRVWSVGELHNLSNKSKKRITRSMDEQVKPSGEFKLLSCFTLGPDIKTWTCEFLPKVGVNGNTTRPQFIIGSPDKVLKAFDVDGVELFDFYGNLEEDDDEEGEDLDADDAEVVKLSTEEIKGDVQMKDEDEVEGEEESGSSASKSKPKSDEKASIKKKLENNFNRINDLSITPDGKVLITANNDRQLHFYKIPELLNQDATTRRIASINIRGRLTSCSVSTNGKYFLLSSAPEELQVWDISGLSKSDGKHFERPILYRKYVGHSQSSYIVRSTFGYHVEESNEEELIMSGSDDGFIYFWKLHTGQLITRVKGHDGLCNSVDWNRHGFRAKNGNRDYGKLWCSVGDDKLVKIWGPSDWI